MCHGVCHARPTTDLHHDRLAQILSGERLLTSGGIVALEQERLPIRRDLIDDSVDLRREAHVEHSIRFVEYQNLEIVEHDILPVEMVDQPSGGGHHDVDSRAQLLLLRLQRDTAVHWATTLSGACFGVIAGTLPRPECTTREWASEPERASCAGLPPINRLTIGRVKAAVFPVPVCARPITSRPCTNERYGLRLDRRRHRIAGVGNGRQHLRRQPQRRKSPRRLLNSSSGI